MAAFSLTFGLVGSLGPAILMVKKIEIAIFSKTQARAQQTQSGQPRENILVQRNRHLNLLCGPSVSSDTTGKWNGVHTKKFITCKFGYDSGPLIAFAYQVFMFVERGNKKNGPAGSSQCQVYLLRDVVINVPLSRLSVNRIILLVRENFSLTYQQNWAEREKPVDFR